MTDLGVSFSSSSAESASVCGDRAVNTTNYSDIPSSSCKELIKPHGCDDLSSDETEFLKVLALASGEHSVQINNDCDDKRLSSTLPLVNGPRSIASRDLSIPIKPLQLHAEGSNYTQPSAKQPTSLGSHWMHNYVITFPETSPLVAEKMFSLDEFPSLDSNVQRTADQPSNVDSWVSDYNVSSQSGRTLFSNYSTEPCGSEDEISKPSQEMSASLTDTSFLAGKSPSSVAQPTSTTTYLTCNTKSKSDLGKGKSVGGMSATQDSRSGVPPKASPIPEESLLSNSDFQDFSALSFNFNLPLFTPPPNGLTETSSAQSRDTSLPLNELQVVENSLVSNCRTEDPIEIMLPSDEVEQFTLPADENQMCAPIVEVFSSTINNSKESVFTGSSSPTNQIENANSLKLEEGSSPNTSQKFSTPIPNSVLSQFGKDVYLTNCVSQKFPEPAENPCEIDEILPDVNCELHDIRSNFVNNAARKENYSPVSEANLLGEDAGAQNCEVSSVVPYKNETSESPGVAGAAVEPVEVPQAMDESVPVFNGALKLTEHGSSNSDINTNISSSICVEESTTLPIITMVEDIPSCEPRESNIHLVDLKEKPASVEEYEEFNPMQDSSGPPNDANARSAFPYDSKSSEQSSFTAPQEVKPTLVTSLNDSNDLPPTTNQAISPDAVDVALPLSSWNSHVPTSSRLVQEVMAASLDVQLPCESYGLVNILHKSYFDVDPSNCEDFPSDCTVDNFSTDEFFCSDDNDGHQKSVALCHAGENLEDASSYPNMLGGVGCASKTSQLSEKSEDSDQELAKVDCEKCVSGVLQQSEKSEDDHQEPDELGIEVSVSETSQHSEKLGVGHLELDEHSPTPSHSAKTDQKITETLIHELKFDTSDTKTNLIDADDARQQLGLEELNQTEPLDSDVDLKELVNTKSDNLKDKSETEISVPTMPVSPTPEEGKDKKSIKSKKVTKKKNKAQNDVPEVAVGCDAVAEKGELVKDTQKVPSKGKKKGKKNKFDPKEDALSPSKKEEPPVVERRRLIRGQKWRQDVSKLRDYKEPLVPFYEEESVQEIRFNLGPLVSEADIKSGGDSNLPVALDIDNEGADLGKCSDRVTESISLGDETADSSKDNSKVDFEACILSADKMPRSSSFDEILEVSDAFEAARDSLTLENAIEVSETPRSDNSATECKTTENISATATECIAATNYSVSNLVCDTKDNEENSQPADIAALPASRINVSTSDEGSDSSANLQDVEETLLLNPIIKDDVSDVTLASSNCEYSSQKSEDDRMNAIPLIRNASDELLADSIGDYHHRGQDSVIDKSPEEDLSTDSSSSIGFHPLNKTQTRIIISTSPSQFKDSQISNIETKELEDVPVAKESSEDSDFPIVVRVSETAEEEQAETEYLSSTSDSSNSQARAGDGADGRLPSSDSWQTDDSDSDLQDWEVLRTGVDCPDGLQNDESIQNLDTVETTFSFSVRKGNVDLDNTKDSIDSNEEYTHYVFESGGNHSSPIKSVTIVGYTDESDLDNDQLANLGMADNNVPGEVIVSPSFEDLPSISGTFDVSYIEPAYLVSSREDSKPASDPSTKPFESASENLHLGEILYDETCQCITSNPRQEKMTIVVKETENVSSDDDLVVPSLFDVETVISQDEDSLHEQLTPPESPLPGNSPRPTSAASSWGQGSDECSCTASREASESPIRGSRPVTEVSDRSVDAPASPSINQSHSPGFISESLMAGTSCTSSGIGGPGTSRSPLSLPSVRKIGRKKISSKKIQQRLERRDTDMLRMPPHVTLEKTGSSLKSSKYNRSLDSLDRMSDSEEDVTEATDTTLKDTTNSPQSFQNVGFFDHATVDSKSLENLNFSRELCPTEIFIPCGQTNLNKRPSDSEGERPNGNGLIQRWEAVQRQALFRQQQSRQLHSLHASIKQLHLSLDALQHHYTTGAATSEAVAAGQEAEGDGCSTEGAKEGGEDATTSSTSVQQRRTPEADAHSLQQLQDRLAIAQARQDRLSEIQAELSQLSLKIHHHSTESGHQLPQLQHQLHHLYQQADHISHYISGELSRLSAACSALEAWQRQAEELRSCLQRDDATLSRLQEAVSGGPAALSRLQLEEGAAAAAAGGDSLSGTARGLAKILAQGQASNGSSGVRSFCGSNSRLSDSGTSGYESCSSDDLSERERRLHALKRLAAELEGTLHPHSLAWTNIKKTISVAESELSSLQKRCRELLLQTAERVAPSSTTSSTLCTRASRRRAAGNQSRISRTSRSSPSRSGRSKVAAPRNGWLWRVVRFALPIQAALLLLFCVSCLLEPSCCDSVNTLNMDLGPQVRFIHGLPPV